MLENAGVRVTVTTATVDEPAERAAMARLAPDIEPGAVALRLADLKALDVSRRLPQALVIGADQVLSVDGDILGKPENLSTADAHVTDGGGFSARRRGGVAAPRRHNAIDAQFQR